MFVNKSIAAILPYGGGCSQYVRIRATDAIDLPKEAGSNEVIALLSTYMTAYQCLESVAGLLHQRSRRMLKQRTRIRCFQIMLRQNKSPLLGKNVYC